MSNYPILPGRRAVYSWFLLKKSVDVLQPLQWAVHRRIALWFTSPAAICTTWSYLYFLLFRLITCLKSLFKNNPVILACCSTSCCTLCRGCCPHVSTRLCHFQWSFSEPNSQLILGLNSFIVCVCQWSLIEMKWVTWSNALANRS